MNFFLGGKDNSQLFLGNRRVLKIGKGKIILEKAFTEAKSGGAKKLRLRTADSVVGLSEREILKITTKSPRFRSFNVKFKNKTIARLVRVKEIQTQHQIDLVNLSDMRVEYQGTVYQYVFPIMDIFSRFHWLAPLERKKPSHIVPHLREIYSVHGPPKNLQSDRGSEFKKEVKTFCNRWKIRSQGKVERSHRQLRNKSIMIW